MKNRTNLKRSIVIISLLVICLAHHPALASLIGPEWPAPGGTNWSGSGNAGITGGLTYSYWGFDSTKYDNLYWGPWEGTAIGASLDGPGISGSEIMTFAGINGTSQAQWTGTSWWTYQSGFNEFTTAPINTRFTLTMTGADPVLASTIDPTKASLGALAPVTGDYSANLLFEANFFGTWLPMDTGFNSYHTFGSTALTYSGGFYHTERVAEPGTMMLLGFGLIGTTVVWRRRQDR